RQPGVAECRALCPSAALVQLDLVAHPLSGAWDVVRHADLLGWVVNRRFEGARPEVTRQVDLRPTAAEGRYVGVCRLRRARAPTRRDCRRTMPPTRDVRAGRPPRRTAHEPRGAGRPAACRRTPS